MVKQDGNRNRYKCRGLYLLLIVFLVSCGGMRMQAYQLSPNRPTAKIRIENTTPYKIDLATYRIAEGCKERRWIFHGIVNESVEQTSEYVPIEAEKLSSFSVWFSVYNKYCTVNFQFVPRAGQFYTILTATGKENCAAMVYTRENQIGEPAPVESVQFMENHESRPWDENSSWCVPLK